MNDEFNWDRRTIPRKPEPPIEIFPTELVQYIISVDYEKVVYRFPANFPRPEQPNEEVMKRLRISKIEKEEWADESREYCLTFYYY